MPTYDYQCQVCEHEWELYQSMKDSPVTHCPKCKKKKAKSDLNFFTISKTVTGDTRQRMLTATRPPAPHAATIGQDNRAPVYALKCAKMHASITSADDDFRANRFGYLLGLYRRAEQL